MFFPHNPEVSWVYGALKELFAATTDPSGHFRSKADLTKKATKRAAIIKRTRNGCTSCKIRKKKCDENLPKCGDCKRLNLQCIRATLKPVTPLSIPFERDSNSDLVLGNAFDFTSAEDYLFLETDCGSSVIDTTPTSASESGSSVYSKAISPGRSESPMQFDRLSLQSPFQHLHGKDQHLLRHFIRVVSRTLSVVHEDDSNPYLRLIIPLAGTCNVVQESLLALSASHLRRIYPEVLERGLAHQNNALASLNSLISNNLRESAEQTLAAVLILCMIEVCDGNSTKWSWHIRAAQTIIRSRQKSSSCNTSTWRFLLSMFGYVDSVITISKCQPPLIAPEELAEDNISTAATSPGPITQASNSYTDSLYGVAFPLLAIINQISELAHRRKDRVDELSELWFRQSAARIKMCLEAWEPEIVSPLQRPSQNQELIDAAYAIQWASILRLHQVVEGYNRSDRPVIESTSKILDHISKIRFGSPAESILIFPLVMAGSGCQDDEQRMMVRERWMVMERTIGFDNIYRARQMVEAVWKEVDEGILDGSNDGGVKVNWAKIRYSDFPGLVLF